MKIDNEWNQLEAGLAGLHRYDADPAAIERIRVRCLVALAAHARRGKIGSSCLSAWHKWFEPLVAFGLSAFYLVTAIGNSLALLR